MKNIFILILIIISIGSYFFYQNTKLQNITNQPQISIKTIPQFSVVNLNNETISSKKLNTKNKKYFIHIWGTWCGPCQSEFPILLNYAKSKNDSDILFYLIATSDDIISVNKYLKKFDDIPTNVVILIDNANSVGRILESNQVPETYLYSEKNELINKFVGPQNWNLAYYRDL